MTDPNQVPDEKPTKAKLFPVTGPVNRLAKQGQGIQVQFNPSTLKVSLANSLKASDKPNNQSAAQYLDKSSSSLSVELIFDTSLEDTDVRQKTKAIAEAFMKPGESGTKLVAPKRCLFQWGAFEFVGLMQSLDETLDFFSPEGTPLRASVSLKLSEDRYQFLSGAAKRAQRDTPQLSAAGADGAADATKDAGQDEKAWRDTAMFNGLESPRLPGVDSLAVPGLSAGASLGAGFGVGAGLGTGIGIGIGGGLTGGASLGLSGGLSASLSGGLSSSVKADIGPPGFSFGASAVLGTGIPGAFSATVVSSTAGLSVTAGLSGGALSAGAGIGSGAAGGAAGASIGASASASASASAGASASAAANASASVGFE